MSYWLISVPQARDRNGQSSRHDSIDQFNKAAYATGLCKHHEFQLPADLKVGTLDSLMALSDDLVKIDNNVGAIAKKLEKSYYELYKAEEVAAAADEKKSSTSTSSSSSTTTTTTTSQSQKIPPITVAGKSITAYLDKFEWDMNAYNKQQPLRSLTDTIVKKSTRADDVVKKQLNDYTEIKQAFIAVDRRDNGSLLVKPLKPYIKPSDLVESDYLTTIFVVIPRNREQEFLSTYENIDDHIRDEQKKRNERHQQTSAALSSSSSTESSTSSSSSSSSSVEEYRPVENPHSHCSNIVPRSAKKLADDQNDDNLLYRFIILKRGLDNIKTALREKRYTYRPFKFDDDDHHQDDSREQLLFKRKTLFSQVVRTISVQFDEVMKAWLHLKAIRLFIETVLRYGLPVCFVAFIIQPTKGKEKQLRQVLQQLYGHLASDNVVKQLDNGENDLSGFGSDFYPYVYLPLQLSDSQ